MAFKYVLKVEEIEGADPNQTSMPGVPKAKAHKKFTPEAAANSLSAIMRFASTVLIDMYPKDCYIVLFAKEKGSEIEMDRWKCSQPIVKVPKNSKTEKEEDDE